MDTGLSKSRRETQFGFDGCVDVLLIARSKSGREVDRWSGPFCDDDEWVIVAAGPTAPP